MSLDPNAVPSANFDLSDWKLQLPIDTRGSFSGKAAEVKTLTSYVHQDYFYTGSDGAMVLAAPVEGATTGGSIYARSELREMDGTANAEWSLRQGGHLSATLQVDAAPRHDDGTYGKIVVGQVHGGDGQLVRLAWEDGTLFFANDITSNGTKDVHIELLNAQGQQPSVSLNETFTYHIDVSADRLVVSVIADGQVYSSSSSINNAWNDNSFYFKAGAYLGVNENNGSGSGQVSIFAVDADYLEITHTGPTETGASVGSMKQEAQNLALLYEAALDRRAELSGLEYWIDQLEGGTSLVSIADLFLESCEFEQFFGNPHSFADPSYVDLLYDNVLGRDGDQQGFNYWVSRLAGGSEKGSVLLEFALSTENEAGSAYVKTLYEDSSGNWMFA